MKVAVYILLQIDRDVMVGTERAEIVDGAHMILMAVGEEHRIKVEDILPEGLIAEVGRGIDEKVHSVGFYKG